VSQINAAVGQLSQTTQQNASSSEELSATAEEMSSQAEQLQQAMAFFKLAEGNAARAMAAGKPRAPSAPRQVPLPVQHGGFRATGNPALAAAGEIDESQFTKF
jgi:methyl-accepting chemotaxis protein